VGPAAPRQYADFVFEDQWRFVPYFQRSDGGWYQAPVFEGAGIKLDEVRLFTDLWMRASSVGPAKELYGWGVTINRSGDGDWFRNRVQHGWGAYKQDETGNYVTFDSPEMVDAMTAMTGIYMDEKYAPMLPPASSPGATPRTTRRTWRASWPIPRTAARCTPRRCWTGPHPRSDQFPCACRRPGEHRVQRPERQLHGLDEGRQEPECGARDHQRTSSCPWRTTTPCWRPTRPSGCPPTRSCGTKRRTSRLILWRSSQKKVARDPAGAIVPGLYPGLCSRRRWRRPLRRHEADMVASILQGTPVAEAVKTCHDRYVQIFKTTSARRAGLSDLKRRPLCCHSEPQAKNLGTAREILRCAQNDIVELPASNPAQEQGNGQYSATDAALAAPPHPVTLGKRPHQRAGSRLGLAWVLMLPTVLLMGGIIAYPSSAPSTSASRTP